VFRHPEEGDVVGGYRLLKKLGDGSFGLVFKAERAGRLFAVKFLHDAAFGTRARREVAILAEMDHPCVVRFQAFDRWPLPLIGTPYIVMDFVDGLTLEAHAAAHNPSARKAARLVFQLALTLGEVHQRGVLHRDLKPTNIIVTSKGEVPVLIDFGVGWHVGAPVATDEGSLPGTLEFQSPEAFQRVGRHEYRPGDELWALGVCFYWLLTDILPFGDRLDEGFMERVLHLKPIPPHVLHPRVPEALSAICMKMLEKKPEDRHGGMVELCTALDGALAEAELDASWDVPLFNPDAPGTPEVPAWVDEAESMRWIRRGMRESPRRGWRPAAAPLAPPSRPERQAPARRPGGALPVGPLVWDLLKWPALVLVTGIVAVFLVVGAVGAVVTAEDKAMPLPTMSSHGDVTGQTGLVREVARPGNPPEAEKSAAPVGAPTPAPKTITMLRTQKSRAKTKEKPAPPSQPEAPSCIPISEWRCTAAGVCSLVLTACPGAQVRPAPAIEPCPPGAVQTMKEQLDIDLGFDGVVSLKNHPGRTAVREDETVAVPLGQELGQLPPGTLLYGRYIFGESRVYGRFTQARKPNGDTFSVCMQISDVGGTGVVRVDKDGGDTAEIPNVFDVEAVPRFANTEEETWRND
jgi:serine/threonine-protein kinase